MAKQPSHPSRNLLEKLSIASVVLVAASLLAGPVRAEGEVRVALKVTNEEGKPVEDLTITMISEEDPTREATTNKKGSATIPNLLPGRWTPTLESEGYRIAAITYSARTESGARSSFSEDNALQNGVPTIEFLAFSRAQLDITVAEVTVEVAEAGSVGLRGLDDASGDLAVLNALFDLQKWDELLVKSQEILDDHPDTGGAHYLRAVALWRTGDYEGAETHMSRAQELIPEQEGINGVAGALFLEHANAAKQAGRDEEAARLANKAVDSLRAQLELTPGVKTHLVNEVIALELAGRSTEAEGVLTQLIEVDPADPRPYLRLADLQIEQGRAEDAVATLDTMPGKGDEVVDFLYNAAVVMFNEDRLDAAISTMAKAIELAPERPMLHQLKGRAHIAKGETAEGVAELEEFIRLSPPDADVDTERQLVEALRE